MTGTPFNGRSSSIFNLEYHLNPRTRQRYNWGGAARFSRKARGELSFPIVVEDNSKQRGRAESRWVSEMGVREQVVEERPSYDKETGAFTGTTTYERPYEEAPGISPLLVAEVLDHAVFFSLKDLGKVLPRYEEIALPVDMEADTYEQYDRTRQMLKDYLIQRKWEGDTTFRGAYLQWAMGWVNTPFRPYQVIHNLKHGLTGEKQPYIVTSIPSYGEERVYPKEQAIIDLIKAELSENRPCVIYLRQTDTRDIQPRIEALIRRYVPEARPFILKNTVDAERREKVIDAEISRGTNVLICNPTLVQTGLDLIYFPTLIFYEITFNLSTMMQAAARSYRLNQNHTLCKVYYLFYEATMEQTAVQLMSRKQRAAKLLTGDIGLTGLDALTEGEGGLEEALLAAIGRDEALLDPSELFKADSAQGVIDAEDAAFWNVEVDEATPTTVVEFTPGLPLGDDPLIAVAIELGGVLHQVEADSTHQLIRADDPHFLMQSVGSYLDNVHIMADSNQYARLQAELLIALTEGIQNEDGTCCVLGMNDLGFKHDPLNESSLRHWLQSWLKEQRLVFTGCEDEVAVKIIHLAKQTLDLLQPENRTATDETMPEYNPAALLPQTAVRKPVSKRVKRKFNLLALPDELAETSSSRPLTAPEELAVQQLALF